MPAPSSPRPNILIIMTDEERYPPPYEDETIERFRRTQLPARERLRTKSLELHRHYAAATACLPSRTSLFTGQYPSLHGVTNTDGLSKTVHDPSISFLDPGSVPTMGDWFRAGGYQTHYRGKWHISHADLLVPGGQGRLLANDDDGKPIPAGIDAYRRADRLDPFGFSGWIGREPHGAAKSDCGVVRDPIYAEQVIELFDDLARTNVEDRRPWLAVASFVNPHDIAFSGAGWDMILGFDPPGDNVPDIAEAPSQADSFAGRPSAHQDFVETWPKVLYPQAADVGYRRLYYHLMVLVDAAIMRILDALDASGMADDTIVVFTSDHGDMLGAHGGMLQKWHNAFDESIRVPLLVSGPGIDAGRAGGLDIATSHTDLLPTLLGLAGIDVEAAQQVVARQHIESRSLPGRDLSAVLTSASADAEAVDAPIYFMTEDQVTNAWSATNIFTGEPFDPVAQPAKVESVITRLPTGDDGVQELWKLNHYYDRMDAWETEHGLTVNPFAPPAAEDQWELHNLTADPEERTNRAHDGDAIKAVLSQLQSMLDDQREAKRLVSDHYGTQP